MSICDTKSPTENKKGHFLPLPTRLDFFCNLYARVQLTTAGEKQTRPSSLAPLFNHHPHFSWSCRRRFFRFLEQQSKSHPSIVLAVMYCDGVMWKLMHRHFFSPSPFPWNKLSASVLSNAPFDHWFICWFCVSFTLK